MLIIYYLILIGVLIYKLPELINKKMFKDLIAFSALYVIGVAIGFLIIFKVDIPTPTDFIVSIFGFMK